MEHGYTWGPERETFSDNSAGYAVLNSVINAPGVGDERNFVRVRPVGSVGQRTDYIEVTRGGRYEVYIYFRNDADSGAALTGVRAQSYFSRFVSEGMDALVVAGLRADGMGVVWDTAKFVTRGEMLELKYVESSAKIHTMGAANNTLMERIFRSPGVELGFDVLNGTLVGGVEYAGYITYEVEAVRAEDAGSAKAFYGDVIDFAGGETMENVSLEETVVNAEMPVTGAGNGIAVAIVMGAVVALGWSLLRKIGNYGKIDR